VDGLVLENMIETSGALLVGYDQVQDNFFGNEFF